MKQKIITVENIRTGEKIKQVVNVVDSHIIFLYLRDELLLNEIKNLRINDKITKQQYRTEKGKINKLWLNENSYEVINFIARRKTCDECDEFINRLEELKNTVYNNIYVEYMGKFFIYNSEEIYTYDEDRN